MTDLATVLEERFPQLKTLKEGRKKNELLQWAQNEFSKCQRTRLQFERQWFLNMAFYFGRQYLNWTANLGAPLNRLIEPKAPPWRVRAVSNKIKPIIRSEHSKLNKERPIPFVIPSTTDDADVHAARGAEIILDHLSREMQQLKVMRRATFWQTLLGNGFVKDWWDEEDTDEQGNRGVLKWEALSPFHVYVPAMLREEIEDQPYVIHSSTYDPYWVYKTYGKRLEPQRSANPTESVMFKIYQALGLHEDEESVIHVHEMWIKQNEHFPEGGRLVWAQDEILYMDEEWPLPYSQYPFTHLTHIPTGRFYADSVVPDLIPLQKEYNRTKSQIIEAKNLMSKPQLTAMRGSIDPRKMTSEPGLIVFYRPGYEPPAPIPLQNLPDYVIQSLELVQRDMDDISSQHEVTKGRTPPGVTAATAIAYLQEEDDSKLSASIASIEEGVEKLGTHTLKWVKDYWTEERIVRVIGDEQVYEAHKFKGADLRDNTSVTVETGSATPRSRAAKQAFIMELGDKGWLSPDQVLQYLDMAESGALYRDLKLDQRQAQRENIRMYEDWEEIIPTMEDEDIPGLFLGTLEVNSWDNHQAHIQEHNNFRKRQAYEMLPEEAQEVFERHVQMHVQMSGGQLGYDLDPGDDIPAELDPDIAEIPLGMGNPEEQPGEPPVPQEMTNVPMGGTGGEYPGEGEEETGGEDALDSGGV